MTILQPMKALPFKIPKPHQDAFYFQIDDDLIFYDKLHQHEEIQLSFIEEGHGTLMVGDSVNYYSQGDILIIGSHLPHVFKSDYTLSKSRMLTLFFTKHAFGTNFFELEELKELQQFFKRSEHGFKVLSHKEELKTLFLQLEKSTKLSQFLLLLQVLKIVSTGQYKSLSSFIYNKIYSDNEGKRMRDVFDYTMDNFDKQVSLKDISEVAAMTKNAFCKYFKKRTNKTYIQFLNELRLEHACKMLQTQNENSISEIAEASGFLNISNFNRQFKSALGMTPLAYRKTKR